MEEPKPPLQTQNKKKVKATAKTQKWWLWPVKIFFLSLALSLVFSIGSEFVMSASGIIISSLIIIVLIVIAVVADMIGVAVTACSVEPFTAMASRKVRGAREALVLLKNAEKVSSLCNDVLGDICGIVSGAAGASIVTRVTVNMTSNAGLILVGALLSSFIAALTIFSKALGKKYSIDNCNKITLLVGKALSPFIGREKTDNTKSKPKTEKVLVEAKNESDKDLTK